MFFYFKLKKLDAKEFSAECLWHPSTRHTMSRWNGRIHILAYGIILIRYYMGRRACLYFSCRMLKEHGSCQTDWWDMWCWDKEWCRSWAFRVPWQWWHKSCFGHMFLKHLCLLISQIGQSVLFQAFRPYGKETMETVETDLEKLIK